MSTSAGCTQQTGNATYAARAFQLYSEHARGFEEPAVMPAWLFAFLDPLMDAIERLFGEAYDRDLTGAESAPRSRMPCN